METIANSAGDTTAVAMVAQPSTGFLNGRFLPDGSPLMTQRTAWDASRLIDKVQVPSQNCLPTGHDGINWNGASAGNIGTWR